MDIFDLYRQYGVRHATSGDRHTTPGWVNTGCPFCTGSPGLHLGFNLQNRFFRCWRCGWHSVVDTLVALCKISDQQARELSYQLRDGPPGTYVRKSSDHLIRITRYKRPSDIGRLRPSHKRYLEGRGFDPDKVETEWHLASTGPAAYLDGIDYRNRIFIPIVWNEREVSFQTRDVSGKSDIKYKTCPMAREAVHHKHIVYGQPECWRKTGIAVEGVTDCWRLGTSAFAVFGIQYKIQQVNLIRKHFDRVMVVFDGDRDAQNQARKLVAQLNAVGVDSELFRLGKGIDPGSMSDDDARHLVRDLAGLPSGNDRSGYRAQPKT